MDTERKVSRMEKVLVILMGLQGSGKSTFYRKYLEGEFVRVNLDTLKTRHRESLLVEECLQKKAAFAVDNTNPTRADRERYILPAKKAGYKVVGCFMESRIKDCVARNELRTGKARVPAAAIAATSNKLELPSYKEGFDELYFVKNDGEAMDVLKWREEDEF